MQSLRIHHIGYLVKKIEKAKQTFLALGYLIEQDTVYDDIRKVNICFLTRDGYRVELVSPATEDSVVSGLIKRYKNSPYHICYETDDFEADIARLTDDGFIAIDTPTPAPALGGRDVVFLSNAAIGMLELLRTNHPEQTS
ncbi:MAG: VOC family protein [Lachnospiraceae bacterium]|nr:VOC family protein [Lachnospiraceae bacterium]